MSAPREALLFLDLDKGRDRRPEEGHGLLQSDPRLRSGWLQYQALQALALETAPTPSEKMVRAVLTQCRREKVSRQLALIAGGDEQAREILLGRSPKNHASSTWILGLLLVGALALGWTVFHGRGLGVPASLEPNPALSAGADPVPFEFPVQTPPADAALSAPVNAASDSDADDVHDESPAARQASRLLREHLHEVRDQASAPTNGAKKMAAAVPVPPHPDAAPRPDAAPDPELTLSSDTLLASAPAGLTNPAGAGPLDILVGMPQRREIDVRLFSPAGKSTRILAAGAYGPGEEHFLLNAKDGHGRALEPGTYFLRVMTPWFSRVLPIQIH